MTVTKTGRVSRTSREDQYIIVTRGGELVLATRHDGVTASGGEIRTYKTKRGFLDRLKAIGHQAPDDFEEIDARMTAKGGANG